MSFNPSNGPIVTDTITLPNLFTSSEDMVQWIRQNLESCGWTATKILAHTTFLVTGAIVPGDTITIDGLLFTFTNGPNGPFQVPVGGDTLATLSNLGAHTAADMPDMWTDYTIGTTTFGFTTVPFISWNVPEKQGPFDPTYDGNILSMAVDPVGSVGVFDYTTVLGQGTTWGGGFTLTSFPTPLGGTVTIKVQTVNHSPSDITITSNDNIALFTNFIIDQTWNILANAHQFVLFVTGVYTKRNFFLCGSLKPYGALASVNFMSGPNITSLSGGNRETLAGIGGLYYVNVTGGYFSSSVVATGQNPNFCLPGWGFGISLIEKLSNKIGASDVKRDTGRGIPYEAFIAACVTTPGGPGIGSDKIYIIGALWDSFISSVYAVQDSTEIVNGKSAIVMAAETGSDLFHSRGSLIMQTET